MPRSKAKVEQVHNKCPSKTRPTRGRHLWAKTDILNFARQTYYSCNLTLRNNFGKTVRSHYEQNNYNCRISLRL